MVSSLFIKSWENRIVISISIEAIALSFVINFFKVKYLEGIGGAEQVLLVTFYGGHYTVFRSRFKHKNLLCSDQLGKVII